MIVLKDIFSLIEEEDIKIVDFPSKGREYIGTVKSNDREKVEDLLDAPVIRIAVSPVGLSTIAVDVNSDLKTPSESSESADVINFRKITTEMADLFAKKNANYGNSFTKLWNDLGPVAGLVPLHNKLDRLTNLVKGGKNDFESIEDTLIDLANYAIMNLLEIQRGKDA